MAFDGTPWFIGGGAHHSPDVARLLAFAATGGAEGIVSPGSLKVRAQTTPGGTVIIGPGSALALNRSAGGADQTYVMRAPTDTEIPVTPTGGSARSDLVVIRVEDPQFSPWQPPADPITAQYAVPFVVQGVPADTTDASTLNLGYSAVAVARLDIPANTGAITSAMVKDVRKLARPRSTREFFSGNPANGDLTSSTFINFPLYDPSITIPLWATHAMVFGIVTGLAVINGDFRGVFRNTLGGIAGIDQPVNYDGAGGDIRVTENVVSQIDVRSLRGRNVPLVLQGRKTSGAGLLRVMGGTRVTFDVQFQERVV